MGVGGKGGFIVSSLDPGSRISLSGCRLMFPFSAWYPSRLPASCGGSRAFAKFKDIPPS